MFRRQYIILLYSSAICNSFLSTFFLFRAGPESTARVNVLKDAISGLELGEKEDLSASNSNTSPPTPDLSWKVAVKIHVL